MSFTELADSLDFPMVVVTTAVRQVRAGCLVGLHCRCGIEPARYSVWLSKANHTFRIGGLADLFAVHFLRARNHSIATLFGTETGDRVDKFARCAWTPGPEGVPLLDDCPDVFVGRRIALLDSGADHVCVVLAPVMVTHGILPDAAAAQDPGAANRWLMSRDVIDLAAAHAATERQAPR